jgi:cytochrome c
MMSKLCVEHSADRSNRPFVPAKAGTQCNKSKSCGNWPLDSRLRGNERSWRSSNPTRHALARLICALALTCTASLAHAQGDAARGEKYFEDCASCHTLANGENGVGPSLFGVFGRKAAALDDYRYSSALKRSGIVWSPQTLDNFIADPQKAVPANRMPYAGMTNASERADLIAYLQKMVK